MKKINILPIILLLGMVSLFSCEDDKVKPVLGSDFTAPTLTIPGAGSTIVLTKPQAAETIDFTWTAADYGVQLAVNYVLQIDKATGDFSNPINVFESASLTKVITFLDFNAKLIALELVPDEASTIKARVKAEVKNSTVTPVYSPEVTLTVTPYEAKENLYIVGQHNGWNNGTAPRMNRNLPGLLYELYLNMPAVDQGFKVLPQLGSWAGDMGDDPANPGSLISEGENNMTVPTPGYWRIRVDLGTMKWFSLKTDWGLIGDATPGGWGSDTDLILNSGTGVWELTVDLVPGEIKFRANDGWDLNLGGSGGVLVQNGPNIPIATAGNYTITMNLNPTGNPQVYTYTVVKN